MQCTPYCSSKSSPDCCHQQNVIMNSTQDWFMMTGDLIINLRSNKTGDAFRLSNIGSFNSKPDLQKTCDPTDVQMSTPTSNEEDQSFVEMSYDESQNELPNNIHNDLLPNLDETNNCENQNCEFDKTDSAQHDKKNTFSSETSNSSSGNSSGPVDEDLSNSRSFSDSSISSPSKQFTNDSHINDFHEDFSYYYENFEDKQSDNCYENIGECNYLSKSHESNLYNLIEDSKSFDNISIDSESGSLVELNSGKHQRIIDAPSAFRLAKRLYNLEGFQKADVTRHLSKNNEYSRAVAEEYLKLFDFTGQRLDEALRTFLSRFYLTGETQERERVLVYFSKRFYEFNTEPSFKSVDSIHTLTCALLLLNTDLHEENIQRKMTCSDFILNLAGMNDGADFSSEMLKYLYYTIKQKPLGWNKDDTIDGVKKDRNVFSKITTISKSISSPYATLPRKYSNTLSSNPFVDLPNPTFAIEYKKGYIRRKCCYDPNGRKTPLGRRSWKMFYATLRDLVLYLHKDENGFRKSQLNENFSNSIRIHHSLASVANDYPKKKFVFRLITADYAEFLFETSDSRELQSWVDTINTTSASLSAPALPMAVSSDNYKFKRELFPVSHTKLSLRDQLSDQENKLVALQMELEHLLEKSGRSSESRIYNQKDFIEKENYLQHEVNRYRIYISCLKRKLKQQTDHQSASECHSLSKSNGAYSDGESNVS